MNKYYCSACGIQIEEQGWPRRCPGCGREHYRNPIPVSVVLVPIGSGVLTVRRAIPPGLGKLALPGGFINWGETWQEAGAREVLEETGLVLEPSHLGLLDAASVTEGVVLLFSMAPPQPTSALEGFKGNSEVSELVIAEHPIELAFSTHTEQLARFFS
jgi:ADP-ribose pyrophosphatase YjhB (NUDIX family)